MPDWTRRGHLIRDGGLRILPLFEYAGLLVALAATLVSGMQEIARMWRNGSVGVTDLLLLFIYLEVLSMIEVYWKAGKLPVRMPLYITMVALARHLMLDTQNLDWQQVVGTSTAIVLLAVAVLLVRFGHVRLPYPDRDEPRNLS